MPVLTFTAAIYRALKRDPEMGETVKCWRVPGEPADVTGFADQLREDIAVLLRSVAVSFGPDEAETQLLLNIVEQVLTRVVWGNIARALLKDFGADGEQAGYSASLPSLAPSAN